MKAETSGKPNKNPALEAFETGRIISEHKERYTVKTHNGEFEAEIMGNLRFTAQSRSDFPAVGDYVAVSDYTDNKMLIHGIHPRNTVLERQAVGKQGEKQIIAANIDTAFIIMAVDRDFSINRIERYLTLCNAAKIETVLVLNKIDLIDDTRLKALKNAIGERIKTIPVHCISLVTGQGIDEIRQIPETGKTYCLLGSSGVGKSTLLNMIGGKSLTTTGAISESTDRGKHVTTRRELHTLNSGAFIIDNPGMREIGITDTSGGIESTFDTIQRLARDCKFGDCTHTNEKGCTVIAAVEDGSLDKDRYENFLKIQREKSHFEATTVEKRQKDKAFGKMVKQVKKVKKNYK